MMAEDQALTQQLLGQTKARKKKAGKEDVLKKTRSGGGLMFIKKMQAKAKVANANSHIQKRTQTRLDLDTALSDMTGTVKLKKQDSALFRFEQMAKRMPTKRIKP